MTLKKDNRRSQGLYADLVRAIDWYDVSLQSIAASKNLLTVNRTQSVMLIHISGGANMPSQIAYEMGTTRQNIHAMAKPLLAAGIIEFVPNPDDGRSKQYVFCDGAIEQRDEIRMILKFLDKSLGERLGKEEFKTLKKALARDWGDVITKCR